MEASLENIHSWFESLQDQISSGLEQLDGRASFREDIWTRREGGGGRSRALKEGEIFEKAGVNFSHVNGEMPQKIANRLDLPVGTAFDATGVSLVIHPRSPHIPIIHMNVRYFETGTGKWWFGGGIDLTPTYVVKTDAQWFHAQLKGVCDEHSPDYYPRFKKWADEYFWLPHRNETRGIGGIFFDHLSADNNEGKKKLFGFVQGTGSSFLPVYTELVNRHAFDPWTNAQKEFQLLRRSRYVEFNLVYDAGTKFGLETGGRTESILVSMPPQARWEYDYQPKEGSPEAETLAMLQPTNWLEE